jgi:uncharacterized membrane protein (UPF0127 family)
VPAPMRVINRTRKTVLVTGGKVASTPWSRLVGLLGRRVLEPGDGLLLRGEQAIHTLGMLFPIDVLYLDREARVLRAVPALPPLRLGPFVRGAQDVLELPSGTLAATQTCEGDELVFEFTS